jgi:hypothetical protein
MMTMSKYCVQSFDIFDTLVARRSGSPQEVFHSVERKMGYYGFAQIRIKAEAELFRGGENYTIDSIYKLIVDRYGISAIHADYLRNAELQEEFAGLIPIAENCSRVQPDDLLISDMYLPMAFIKKVISEKCGLHFNPVYLSSHGKISGEVWKTIKEHYTILNHLGNNQKSDVDGPKSYDIPAEKTDAFKFTKIESYLMSEELGALARFVRAKRLAFWTKNDQARKLGSAQIEVNFPFLFTATLLLIRYSHHNKWKRILFSARDCYLWYRLFCEIATIVGLDVTATYFLTSRIARAFPSRDYLRYFEHSHSGAPAVVVDICGTGWSLKRLLQASKAVNTDIFLLHQIEDEKLVTQYESLGGMDNAYRVVKLTSKGNNNLAEALNTAPHSMIEDVREIDGNYFPVSAELREADGHRELIQLSHRVFEGALADIKDFDRGELLNMLSTVHTGHLMYLYNSMANYSEALSPIRAQQLAENGPAIQRLRHRSEMPSVQCVPKDHKAVVTD